jgi:hypothetical protein
VANEKRVSAVAEKKSAVTAHGEVLYKSYIRIIDAITTIVSNATDYLVRDLFGCYPGS